MNFLEKDLEVIIFEASKTKKGIEILKERGLWAVRSPLIRQLNLAPYGIADLVQITYSVRYGSPHVEIDIFELKKDEVNVETFLQAIGYAQGVRKFCELSVFGDTTPSVRLHLIGKKIHLRNNFPYLSDWLKFDDFSLHIYEYSADIESGFLFSEKSGYHPSSLNDSHGADFCNILNTDEANLKDFFQSFTSGLLNEMKMSDDRAELVWGIFMELKDPTIAHLDKASKILFKNIATDVFSAPEQSLPELRETIISKLNNIPF